MQSIVAVAMKDLTIAALLAVTLNEPKNRRDRQRPRGEVLPNSFITGRFALG
jgi:hypothetical protein